MSDCEGTGFCVKCNSFQDFFLSGSGTKGSCMKCNNEQEFKDGEVKIYFHQDAYDDLQNEEKEMENDDL